MDSQRVWSPRPSPLIREQATAVSRSRVKSETSAPDARLPSGVSASWNFANMPVLSAGQANETPAEVSSKPLFLQSKLEIGAVDSPLEREADQVAARVMRAPGAGHDVDEVDAADGPGRLQRKCDGCKNEEEEKNQVSRAPIASSATSFDNAIAPSIVDNALQTPSQPLDAASHLFMQSRFGHDFSRVRIHSDESAAQSAAAIRARAYTVGESVVFARNQYDPHGDEGRGLLAHELVHVLQQRDASPASGDASGRSATQAGRAVVQRSPGDGTRQGSGSSLTQGGPQLTLGGHTIVGDRLAVDRLLASELTVGRYLQPTYLGSPMSLDAVANLLQSIAPTLPEGELRGRVHFQWGQKLAATPRLPPLFESPVQISLGPSASAAGRGGAGSGSAAPTTTPDAPARGLPDMAGGGSQSPSGASGGGGSWSPSVGPQVVVNLVRGPGPPVDSAMQRQYAMGDNVQILFQDSTDVGTGAYQVVGGAQALSPNIIHSEIVKLQPFIQLVAGFSEVPGVTSASMVVQLSFGAQLSFVFGPVTLQLSAGIQQTAQSGQATQPAAAFSATLGPTSPEGDSGIQNRGNWYFGVAPPPPLPGPAGGPGGYPSAGGGMFIFGGRF